MPDKIGLLDHFCRDALRRRDTKSHQAHRIGILRDKKGGNVRLPSSALFNAFTLRADELRGASEQVGPRPASQAAAGWYIRSGHGAPRPICPHDNIFARSAGAAGKGPRRLRSGRPPAAGQHRSDQRLRLGAADGDSRQGAGVDANCRLLVRVAGRAEPPDHHRRGEDGPARRAPTAACWPAARRSAARRRSCRSSAWCAAIWPGRAGRNISRAARSAASSCPPD